MKMKNENQQKGYDFAEGVAMCLFKYWIIGAIMLLVWNCFRGMDDSDASKWNRSGLKIHTDKKTGIEYLSDGKGGLIVRQATL